MKPVMIVHKMLMCMCLIIQAILSFGLGGYLAGRVRASTVGRAEVVEEIERADGVHGLGAWAVAVVMARSLHT